MSDEKRIQWTFRRLVPAAAAAAAALVGGAAIYASIPSANGVIVACYKKSGGNVRVIDAAIGSCDPNNEIRLEWNQIRASGPGPAGGANRAARAGRPAGRAGVHRRSRAGGPARAARPGRPGWRRRRRRDAEESTATATDPVLLQRGHRVADDPVRVRRRHNSIVAGVTTVHYRVRRETSRAVALSVQNSVLHRPESSPTYDIDRGQSPRHIRRRHAGARRRTRRTPATRTDRPFSVIVY